MANSRYRLLKNIKYFFNAEDNKSEIKYIKSSAPRLPFSVTSKIRTPSAYAKKIDVDYDSKNNTFKISLPQSYIFDVDRLADSFDEKTKANEILDSIYKFVDKWYGNDEYIKDVKTVINAASIIGGFFNPMAIAPAAVITGHDFMKRSSLWLTIKEFLFYTLKPESEETINKFNIKSSIKFITYPYEKILSELNHISFRTYIKPWLNYSVFNTTDYLNNEPALDAMLSIIEFNRVIGWDRMLAIHCAVIKVNICKDNDDDDEEEKIIKEYAFNN